MKLNNYSENSVNSIQHSTNISNNNSKETQINNEQNINNTNIKNSNSIHINKQNNQQTNIINVFENYKPGENVPGDGNCGLYAICNALNDNKSNKITSILELLELFNLSELPNYWWADDELASIADHYGYDTYIYNDNNSSAIVYEKGQRPAVVLYNVNKNSHWIPPGTLTTNKSNKIPKTITCMNHTPSLQSIIDTLKNHTLNKESANITRNNNIQISNEIIMTISQYRINPLQLHINITRKV